MRLKRILGEVLLLTSLAAVAGAVSNSVRREELKLAWIGHHELPRAAPAARAKERTVPAAAALALAPPKDPGTLFLAIDGELVHRLFAADALFIDARRTSAYEAGHIAGARGVAVWEHDVDAKVAALAAEKLPYETVMVIYCSGGACEDSEMLAAKLGGAGFYNLYVYRDGYPDWVKRGLPSRVGGTP
jgi:rhodanese-related sulfurtransferase